MPKFINRIGMKYGRLTVVEHKGRNERGVHLWLCKCDCGNYKIVSSNNLSSKKSNSCGCLKAEALSRNGGQYVLAKDRERAILKVQYSHLCRRHKKFNGDILSLDDYIDKVKQPCHYCGLEHSREIKDRKNETIKEKLLSDTIVLCNGLDRIDSNIGYTKENTVPCCKDCNYAKRNMSVSEFFKWINRVYNYNRLGD